MERHLNYDLAETLNFFDAAFSPGGVWEANNGRQQTRRFAECFVRSVKIPLDDFSLLDVGCALGDASSVLRGAYPRARLYGCDVSRIAVERSRQDFGHFAEFFRAGFEEISGFWDVIYCSNVLEHFEEYADIAAWLLSKCSILYLMTPYFELDKGRPLAQKGEKGAAHLVTLYKDSFDEFYDRGLLSTPVRTKIIRCTKAWSPPLWKEISREVRRGLKMALRGRYFPPRARQIIYELRRRDG